MVSTSRHPSGFTLLELVLAIVLTSIAVAIAGSALRTADIARDGVVANREQLEKESRLREMLTDMLRHAPSGELIDEALVRVAMLPTGAPQLVFLSRGVRQPFGTGNIWRVALSADAGGLSLDAQPVGIARGETALHSHFPDITTLRVEFLESGTGTSTPAWRVDWPIARARPAMIALHFGDDSSSAPLLVTLDPLATASIAMGTR